MGEFQSGQMGQTVNLLSLTSVVRIHPLPLLDSLCRVQGDFSKYGGIAQLGECLTGSQEVTGSSPVISTISITIILR